MTGGYVVYEDRFGPKLLEGAIRYYWQGGTSRCWGGGDDYRNSAPRFGDQHAARAALVEAGEAALSTIGYEWVPGKPVQPALFAVDGADQ